MRLTVDENDDDNYNKNIKIIMYWILSLHCNTETRQKESYDTRHITFLQLSTRSWRLVGSFSFSHVTDTQDGLRLASCDPDSERDKTECCNYQRVRIAERLNYYTEMKYNWRMFLARFVTYSVKRNIDIVGMSSCVSVSHWFREEDLKNYKII